ncbi:MAG: ArnT family glycosyltransferase [Desulfobacteraceae bacterium]
METRFRSRYYRLLLALILFYAACFRLLVLDFPFQYDAEGWGCFYGVLARNYLNFGWGETYGMPVLTVGHIPDVPIVFYNHHPPLVPLLIVPFYALFGVGEWQTRLPTAIATVSAIYVLFLLMERVSNRRVALTAAALFASTPLILYFGGLPEVVNMPLVLFVLLTVMAYLKFYSYPSGRTLCLLLVSFSLAGISDWPAFIIIPIFLVHFVVNRPRYQWPWIIAFCVSATGLFALIYIYIMLSTGASLDWMLPSLKCRTGINAQFTIGEWLTKARDFQGRMHTFSLVLVSFAWIFTFGWRLHHPHPGATVARILLAWGILHVLIGRQGVFIHEWWYAPLTPGLCVGAALLLDRIMCLAERHRTTKAVNCIIVLLIVLLASWTSLHSFQRLHNKFYGWPPDINFTSIELGEAVRTAAPQTNDVALLVWTYGAPPHLWFYGNRPLRLSISSLEEFQSSIQDNHVTLIYDYIKQPWEAPAAGIVFPLLYRQKFRDLWAHLQKHYHLIPLSPSLAGKFAVFDLRSPPFNGNARCNKE